MGQKQNNQELKTYVVNTQESIERLQASRYVADRDWVHFWDEAGNLRASFQARNVLFVIESDKTPYAEQVA